MSKLTQKEWGYLNEYVKDLLEGMKQDKELKICDGCEEYTIQELNTLQQKLLKKVNNFSDL